MDLQAPILLILSDVLLAILINEGALDFKNRPSRCRKRRRYGDAAVDFLIVLRRRALAVIRQSIVAAAPARCVRNRSAQEPPPPGWLAGILTFLAAQRCAPCRSFATRATVARPSRAVVYETKAKSEIFEVEKEKDLEFLGVDMQANVPGGELNLPAGHSNDCLRGGG